LMMNRSKESKTFGEFQCTLSFDVLIFGQLRKVGHL
jgi:hypothetical protein